MEEMKKFYELETIAVLSKEAHVHDKFLDTITSVIAAMKYLYRGKNITLCYQTTMKLQSHG